ncbi:hypothetical protein F5Y15DRAFT_161203 [Xylariaceae sp. FL0016]|nr:hypothetical protein F5Y15DRAFT_161203 [Xylariaceae sp. FL0016]
MKISRSLPPSNPWADSSRIPSWKEGPSVVIGLCHFRNAHMISSHLRPRRIDTPAIHQKSLSDTMTRISRLALAFTKPKDKTARMTWCDSFEHALYRQRTLGTSPAPMPPRTKDPPKNRRGPTSLSYRKARGAGWHRRGYRDHGCMWLNVKEGSYGCVRGEDVLENAMLALFVKSVISARDRKFPRGWYCDL